MDLVSRAVWTIETGLFCRLSLSFIAEECGVSQYHLSRVFRSATGMSVMVYVRSRRLSHAASVLAEGNAEILDVALDSQYNSHEAFTRAFSSYFGVLPSSVRENKSTCQLNVLEPFIMDNSLLVAVKSPTIQVREQFQVTGISRQYTFETNYGIPEQWGLFVEHYHDIQTVTGDVSYGVCYDADAQGRFLYLTGLETDATTTVPNNMERIVLPVGRYAVFEHEGHISDYRKTIYTIWNKSLPEEGLEHRTAPDFEVYDNRFDADTGLGLVEIWIPIA